MPDQHPAPVQQPHPHPEFYAHEVKTLLTWTAPARPYIKRGREFYATSLLLMLFVEVIVFLFGQYMLMLLIVMFVFAVFALYSTPPHNVQYKISSEGITIDEHFFLWKELYDFYFKTMHGVEVLQVRTEALIPGIITIPLGDMHKEHIKQVLLAFLPYRETVKLTGMEKAGDWLAKTFPLERQKPR